MSRGKKIILNHDCISKPDYVCIINNLLGLLWSDSNGVEVGQQPNWLLLGFFLAWHVINVSGVNELFIHLHPIFTNTFLSVDSVCRSGFIFLIVSRQVKGPRVGWISRRMFLCYKLKSNIWSCNILNLIRVQCCDNEVLKCLSICLFDTPRNG